MRRPHQHLFKCVGHTQAHYCISFKITVINHCISFYQTQHTKDVKGVIGNFEVVMAFHLVVGM